MKGEYDFFHLLFDHSKKSKSVFNRAVHKSDRFWAANADVLRRSAKYSGPDKLDKYMGALTTLSSVMTDVENAPADPEGKESSVDALMQSWFSAGVLGAFEATVDTWLRVPGRASQSLCALSKSDDTDAQPQTQ